MAEVAKPKRRRRKDIKRAKKERRRARERGIWTRYKIEGGKLIRLFKFCPKCGRPMATHKDRYSCGYCGYTEFKTAGA